MGPERGDGEDLFEAIVEPPIPKVATLVEIVGATNLGLLLTPAATAPTTPVRTSFLPIKNHICLPPDTRCEVYLGEELVHKTNIISADNNPIWTVQTNSLGILQVPDLRSTDVPLQQEEAQEQQQVEEEESRGTTSTALSSYKTPPDETKTYVVVKLVNGKECLGSVNIPLGHVLNAQGEREEFPLVGKNSNSSDTKETSILALRFRPASQEDIAFVNDVEHRRNSSMLVSTAQTLRSSMSSSSTPLEPSHADEATDINFHTVTKTSMFSSSKKKDDKTGETLVRLQPPKRDPDLPNEPPVEWMTKARIQQEALEPSWKWVETGHGQTGKLYLEIIGCDNLPNLVRLNCMACTGLRCAAVFFCAY